MQQRATGWVDSEGEGGQGVPPQFFHVFFFIFFSEPDESARACVGRGKFASVYLETFGNPPQNVRTETA